MPWSKIDDAVFGHPKLIAAGAEGVAMWLMALAYSSRYMTDGYVPAVVVPTLYPLRRPGEVARRLVEAGLFDDVGNGSFAVHDFCEYNPSAAEVAERRAAERAKKARQRQVGTASSGRSGSNGRYVSPRDNIGDTPGESRRDTLGESPPMSPGESPGDSPATRTRPHKSSSSSEERWAANRPDDDDDEIEKTVEERYRRRVAAKGPVGDPLAWKAKARANLLAEVAERGSAVLVAERGGDEAAGLAQRLRHERANRRARGEACGLCDGAGVVLVEGADVAEVCECQAVGR